MPRVFILCECWSFSGNLLVIKGLPQSFNNIFNKQNTQNGHFFLFQIYYAFEFCGKNGSWYVSCLTINFSVNLESILGLLVSGHTLLSSYLTPVCSLGSLHCPAHPIRCSLSFPSVPVHWIWIFSCQHHSQLSCSIFCILALQSPWCISFASEENRYDYLYRNKYITRPGTAHLKS